MQIIISRRQLAKALKRHSKDRFLVVSIEALRISAIQPLSDYAPKPVHMQRMNLWKEHEPSEPAIAAPRVDQA
jgi:hypothetical protein